MIAISSHNSLIKNVEKEDPLNLMSIYIHNRELDKKNILERKEKKRSQTQNTQKHTSANKTIFSFSERPQYDGIPIIPNIRKPALLVITTLFALVLFSYTFSRHSILYLIHFEGCCDLNSIS